MKRHQDTVYWVDMQFAQPKGLKFHQTRCNAFTFTTLPAYFVSKVVVMDFGGNHIRESTCITLAPPTISFEDNWMKELDSEVTGSSHTQNPTKNQKPNYQERRTYPELVGRRARAREDARLKPVRLGPIRVIRLSPCPT